MKSRITKIATAAIIIIAVMIGINQFGGSLDMAGAAYAKDGQKVALDRFQETSNQMMGGVYALVGEDAFIRPTAFKAVSNNLLKTG